MTASQIARTIHGVKAGKRWSCRCPVPAHAHGDRNRSLVVWNSDDGWTCFKCHVGHDRMAILSAMGLGLRDIGPDGQKREWTLPASVAKRFKEAGPAIKRICSVCRISIRRIEEDARKAQLDRWSRAADS